MWALSLTESSYASAASASRLVYFGISLIAERASCFFCNTKYFKLTSDSVVTVVSHFSKLHVKQKIAKPRRLKDGGGFVTLQFREGLIKPKETAFLFLSNIIQVYPNFLRTFFWWSCQRQFSLYTSSRPNVRHVVHYHLLS